MKVSAPCANGCNGSFDGELRDGLLNREVFYTLEEANVPIKNWRCEDSTIRPHGSPGNRPFAPQTRTLIPALAFTGGGRLH